MLSQVRWLRVVVAAFLIEVALIVFTLPFILIVAEAVVYKAIVPVACVVVPFVVTFIATRPLPAARALNGFVTGVVATVMYFALVVSASSIAEASMVYGLPLFFGVNLLRIASASAGGYAADRRAIPSAA
jgi:hypothetical protein